MSEFLKRLLGETTPNDAVPDIDASMKAAHEVFEEARGLILKRSEGLGKNYIERTIIIMIAVQMLRGWLIEGVQKSGRGSIVEEVWDKLDALFGKPDDEG